MNEDGIPTRFLPATRSPREEIEKTRRFLVRQRFLLSILDNIPLIVLILNNNRQIVLANKAAISFATSKGVGDIFGLRLGEMVECVHAFAYPGGCGTSEFCAVCGAVNAVLASQKGKQGVQDSRITRTDGDAMDLRVWATPLKVAGESYTFAAIMDTTDEKRRRRLERIFFHDILNSMSAVFGAASILKSAPPEVKVELEDIILSTTERLIGEINAQKDVTAAEIGELPVNLAPVSALAVLEGLVALYEKTEIAAGKKLVLDPASVDIMFNTNQALVSRVLGNMIKNALEASRSGDAVILKSESMAGNRLRFSVHNPGYMPEEVCLQVFQRSFSTKAGDRGLGTYSMKLLSERYLNGSVSFTTSEKNGTTFFAEYPL